MCNMAGSMLHHKCAASLATNTKRKLGYIDATNFEVQLCILLSLKDDVYARKGLSYTYLPPATYT